MMKTFFFVPGNNPKFIENANNLNVDFVIYDLEDAILDSEINDAINNIKHVYDKKNKYIRLGFSFSNSFQLLDQLLDLGFTNFVLPKIESLIVLQSIRDYIAERKSSFALILLIESPQALVRLQDFLTINEIIAIGLGSHDYCNTMKMEHKPRNFDWANKYILNYAKAFRKLAIDVVSMNIVDEDSLKNEFLLSSSAGYDGKFFIHPVQLKAFRETDFISKDEIELAKEIRDYVNRIGGIGNFKILNLRGRVIEKPHLERFRKILNDGNYESF